MLTLQATLLLSLALWLSVKGVYQSIACAHLSLVGEARKMMDDGGVREEEVVSDRIELCKLSCWEPSVSASRLSGCAVKAGRAVQPGPSSPGRPARAVRPATPAKLATPTPHLEQLRMR